MCSQCICRLASENGLIVQLIYVWVENPVDEAYARALVWIAVWQLHVYLPKSAGEWRWERCKLEAW